MKYKICLPWNGSFCDLRVLVLPFPVDRDTHEFFCRLQSKVFDVASLFQANHVVHRNPPREDIFFCVASWLFRITWSSFTTSSSLSSRGKLTALLSRRMHLKNRSEFVLIIFYLQLINSGHADSSMADKKHDKLSSEFDGAFYKKIKLLIRKSVEKTIHQKRNRRSKTTDAQKHQRERIYKTNRKESLSYYVIFIHNEFIFERKAYHPFIESNASKKPLRICPDHILSSADKQRSCWQSYGRQKAR